MADERTWDALALLEQRLDATLPSWFADAVDTVLEASLFTEEGRLLAFDVVLNEEQPLPRDHGWMRLGLLLNRIVSPIVLGIVFFLVVTPLGLIMRMTGRNPMGKLVKSDEGTCRVTSTVRDANHLEKPY